MKGSQEEVEYKPGPEGPAIMTNPTCRTYSDVEVISDAINQLGRQFFKQIVLMKNYLK